ncbi:hypothetical protein BBN03_12860 [Vibrio parahaemolyticus]|uniref:hypothetical protein n=1 Tax=Vibrio parahaemolyticus TaxID=670 RepID=UPI00084AF344|nr:hypothetical protein [Vibrio parahaemolyticus]EJI6687774.1 hypothetical protein [Vibrio parahaemolyticus]OEA86078.1 hypothetical protein BBN03_12860 [Vibrio parahaemolyticus]
MNKLTLREYLSYLLGQPLMESVSEDPSEWKRQLSWPPNAFGVAARILEESGYYTQLVSPNDSKHLNQVESIATASKFGQNCDDWIKNIDRRQYRNIREALHSIEFDKLKDELPMMLLDEHCLPDWLVIHVEKFFSTKNLDRTFGEILEAGLFVDITVILSSADHACAGLGVNSLTDSEEEWFTSFLKLGELLLDSNERKSLSTFCNSRLSVVPKMLVPQTGISINSLSHNLACVSGETTVYWNKIHYPSRLESELDILIVPFPFKINKDHFSIKNDIKHNIKKASYFSYSPTVNIEEITDIVENCISNALESQRKIDFIVFPEATFNTLQYYKFLLGLREICIEKSISPCVVAGVINSDSEKVFSDKNTSVLTPWDLLKTINKYDEVPSVTNLGFEQVKHHRWQLDEKQIATYGLTAQLPIKGVAWEAMAIDERRVAFNQVGDWFSLCTLVCEDLARQEPVARTIRSVGPNLVIALLLDGPQLSNRWPGRYATGLTEEPGSSVLTVTALGMSLASVPKSPNYKPDPKIQRTIALWKDSLVGTIQIDIDEGKSGVILNLDSVTKDEISADGRSCGGEAVVLAYRNHYSV